jgi:thioredoxin 1
MTIENVTDANFREEVIAHQGSVVVVFEADWSGACHIVAPIIEDLARVFDGRIKVCKLDVTTNGGLVDAYGVRGLPTLLFFMNGKIVDSHTGIVSKEQLRMKLESLLT